MAKCLPLCSIVAFSHYLMEKSTDTNLNYPMPTGRIFIRNDHLANGWRQLLGNPNVLNAQMHEGKKYTSYDPRGVEICRFISQGSNTCLEFKADGEGMFIVALSCPNPSYSGIYQKWFNNQ